MSYYSFCRTMQYNPEKPWRIYVNPSRESTGQSWYDYNKIKHNTATCVFYCSWSRVSGWVTKPICCDPLFSHFFIIIIIIIIVIIKTPCMEIVICMEWFYLAFCLCNFEERIPCVVYGMHCISSVKSYSLYSLCKVYIRLVIYDHGWWERVCVFVFGDCTLCGLIMCSIIWVNNPKKYLICTCRLLLHRSCWIICSEHSMCVIAPHATGTRLLD